MEKEKSLNTFSIIAFIFSIMLFPVGLILSIIGMVRCKNYKKENGKNPSYFVFNIIGLAVSILQFIITMFILVIVIFVFGILSYNKKYVDGSYTCYYPNSTKPAISAEFKDNKFRWSKYNDEKNNSIYGSYRLNAVKINNDIHMYKLVLAPNKYETSAKITPKDRYNIVIKKINNKTTITFDNGTTYDCTKGILNEF